MSDFVLVDTDVFSFFIKGDSRADLYSAYLQQRTIALAFQTVAELFQWAELHQWGETRREGLDSELGKTVLLNSDQETARLWAVVTATRVRFGRPISPQDAWVAACALRYDIPLVTHNAKDYAGIPGLAIMTESNDGGKLHS